MYFQIASNTKYHTLCAIHNIIQIHNSVLWDQQYSTEYSKHSGRILEYSVEILSGPQNTVMDLNNVKFTTLLYDKLYIIVFGLGRADHSGREEGAGLGFRVLGFAVAAEAPEAESYRPGS